jgi:hypothetical protein
VFRFHALNSVCLDGKWVRATPVFTKLLCRLYGITPLEFDGTADSMSHPYDSKGRRYLEFLHDYGGSLVAEAADETGESGLRAA